MIELTDFNRNIIYKIDDNDEVGSSEQKTKFQYSLPKYIQICRETDDHGDTFTLLNWGGLNKSGIRYDIVMGNTRFGINKNNSDFPSASYQSAIEYNILDCGGVGSYTDNTYQSTRYAFMVGFTSVGKDEGEECFFWTTAFNANEKNGQKNSFDKVITDNGGNFDVIHFEGSTEKSLKIAVEGNDIRLSIDDLSSDKKRTILIKDQLANNGREIEALQLGGVHSSYNLVNIAQYIQRIGGEWNLHDLIQKAASMTEEGGYAPQLFISSPMDKAITEITAYPY